MYIGGSVAIHTCVTLDWLSWKGLRAFHGPGPWTGPSVTPLLPTAALSAHILAPAASIREGETAEEGQGACCAAGGHRGRYR